LNYATLLKGVKMFGEDWGKDIWYTTHVLRDRDTWENLDSITKEQINDVVIEFLRQYWVQYTYDIDREELKETLRGLNESSNIIRGKRLLVSNLNEKVDVRGGKFSWISMIIKEMYNDLRDVHGIGPTSASKILHGINPQFFMMWDRFIRPAYAYYKGDAGDYLKFMADCQKILKKVVESYQRERNCDVTVAEKELCEQAYTELGIRKPLAKLLDEYNWMKYRNKKDLPDPWLDP